MARRTANELAFTALAIEAGLLAPDFLNKIAHLEAAAQGEADYDIPRGLKLRDEIGRYWKIAQNLWQDFAVRHERADRDPFKATAQEFLEPFCRQVLGFGDIRRVGTVEVAGRGFPVGWAAADGRVPLVFAGHDQPLDKPGPRHGDGNRRRSPFLLTQEYLNANHAALWAVVSNGLKLRVLRDNPSLTRPAYVEADLEAIFNEGLYPDFAALWLFAHASRFGKAGAEPADCPLERWRNTAQEDGIRARDRLREGVADALRALGTGFLAHPANGELRRRLEGGELPVTAISSNCCASSIASFSSPPSKTASWSSRPTPAPRPKPATSPATASPACAAWPRGAAATTAMPTSGRRWPSPSPASAAASRRSACPPSAASSTPASAPTSTPPSSTTSRCSRRSSASASSAKAPRSPASITATWIPRNSAASTKACWNWCRK